VIFESVATGIVSNYIFGVLSASCPEAVRKLAPALFFGGPTPLMEAEKAFQEAKANLLHKYGGDVGVERFLSDSTLREGALEPLFANIFLSKPLVARELDRRFFDSFDSTYVDRRRYRTVIDDIVSEIRRALLSRSATSPFVLESSLREIHQSLEALKKISENYSLKLLPYADVRENGNKLDDFSEYYLSELKEYIRSIFINGLEMISKKERISHPIGEAYVPILVHHAHRSPDPASDDYARTDAFDVVRDSRRLIVRGPAGCGKTTLMQWLIWNADPFADKTAHTEKHQMFPIYIPLRRLESLGTINFSADSILYASMQNDMLRREYPKNWLDGLLRRGIDVIILIDGIDEMAEKNRSNVWRFVRELCEKYPTLRMLITSRHISTVHLSDGSYRPEIFLNEESFNEAKALWNRPDDFFEFVVSPLSNSDIVDLIDRWFIGVDPNLLARDERDRLLGYPERLKKDLFEKNNYISLELARTPLLCSLICLVFFLHRGRLPRNRKQLYEFSTLLLVEMRDEQKGVRTDERFSNFDMEKRLQLMKYIALIMQEGSESVQADQSIEVDKDRVISWLDRHLSAQTALKLSAKDYLEFLVERCSIIREPSAGRIDFIHRSFMEYLAAEEIVISKQAYQLREKIVLEEWWNTLTFCMSTTAGGAYFGSQLLKETLEYLLDSKIRNRRKFLVKALSLLRYLAPVAHSVNDALKRAAYEVLPPSTETESADMSAIPVAILEEVIPFDRVHEIYGADQLDRCIDLLCLHEDEEVKRIFLSGYVKLPSQEIIKKINQTGRVGVHEHVALYKRLQNGSFTEPVYLTTDNLQDRELRVGLANINIAWIKLPVIGDRFVGWDFLHKCREVKLINAHQSDFKIISNSVKTRRFEKCKTLTIAFGHGFDFSLIAKLFPEVRTITIDRSSGIHLTGLNDMSNLEELWIENCTQAIELESEHIPQSLRELVFFRSVNPIVKSQPPGLQVHTEKLSKDNILLH
jgi:NACHT domain